MQTFLPDPNIANSAAYLDNKRLGKQRVEVLQILRAMKRRKGGWANHPAVLMWKPYKLYLVCYGLAICREWKLRGFKDRTAWKIRRFIPRQLAILEIESPWWLGDNKFHSAHRAALKAKLPSHYRQFGWKEKPRIAYWWPVTNRGVK